MMTETQFLQHTDALFAHIEDALDAYDLDCAHTGNVLSIETNDGTQIIINRHVPNQELWLAAHSNGYHFAYQNGQWLATRDENDFFTVLNQALNTAVDQSITITPFQAA